MAILNEISTKELSKIDIWRIIRDITTNKKVLVIHDFLTASIMALNNEVYYITDDEIKRNLFVRHVINSVNFGNNDKAELIKDWRTIDEFINENFGDDIMFDLIIGNPPYGDKHIRNLHFDIASVLLNYFKEKMILIMPNKISITNSNQYDSFKNKANGKLSEIIDVGNPFEGQAQVRTGVFIFEKTTNKITITYNNETKEYESLFDINNFSVYEDKFMSKLKSDFAKKYIKFMGYDEDYENKLDKYNFSINRENGAMNGMFFSSLLINEGIKTKQDMIDFLKSYTVAHKVCVKHSNKIFLENLKNAMLRPLLRFGLFKSQDDQNMPIRVLKYIPDIDWSDDKTLTDAGILEMCGFSKNEAKEFAKYCKDFMNNVYVINIKPKKTVRKVVVPTIDKEQINKLNAKAKVMRKTFTAKQKKIYHKMFDGEWAKINKRIDLNNKLERSLAFAKARISCAKKVLM